MLGMKVLTAKLPVHVAPGSPHRSRGKFFQSVISQASGSAGRAVRSVRMGRYTEEFRHSIDDPEGFWGGAVQGIDWYRQPAVVLDSPVRRSTAGSPAAC